MGLDDGPSTAETLPYFGTPRPSQSARELQNKGVSSSSLFGGLFDFGSPSEAICLPDVHVILCIHDGVIVVSGSWGAHGLAVPTSSIPVGFPRARDSRLELHRPRRWMGIAAAEKGLDHGVRNACREGWIVEISGLKQRVRRPL